MVLLFLVGCTSQSVGGPEGFGPDGTPRAAGPGANYPIILAHGFISSAETGFSDSIVAALQQDGFTVFRSQVPPVQTVAARAQALGGQIDSILSQTGAPKVHLVGHSMGGLDSRYVVSQLGYADRVASVTTISTPHHGSPLADVALDVQDPTGLRSQVVLALAQLTGAQVGSDPNLQGALRDLSEGYASTFNGVVGDMQGVIYSSYAGVSTVGGRLRPSDVARCNAGAVLAGAATADSLPLVLTPTAGLIAENILAPEPHDGVVSVASATWTNFRGCIPADHFEETSPETASFDLVGFYRQVAADLAQIG